MQQKFESHETIELRKKTFDFLFFIKTKQKEQKQRYYISSFVIRIKKWVYVFGSLVVL